MVGPCVQAVSTDDIARLVSRLERYGPLSTKMRCFLLLLQSGVNCFQHWIYASDEESQPPVAIVITLAAPDLLVVDAFALDEAASLRRLCAALLSPPVSARLWQAEGRLRADCWPRYLQPVLERAAGQRGFTTTPISGGAHLFIREPPVTADCQILCPAGVVVRPLSVLHLPKVAQHWPYFDDVPDAEAMLQQSVTSGLSAGVFLLDTDQPAEGDAAWPPPPPADRLVSWALLNSGGQLGFVHTMVTHRRRGLARLAVAELTARCLSRRLPCVVATGRDNAGMVGAVQPLGYSAVHDVFWAAVTPAAPPPAQQSAEDAPGRHRGA